MSAVLSLRISDANYRTVLYSDRMVVAVHEPRSTDWSIASVSRCSETGVFRLVLAIGEDELRVDLSICWYEAQNLAWLTFIEVDQVHTRDSALAATVTAWIAANETRVFRAALEVA